MTQTRTIGGVAGAFTTLSAYDAADRVVTVTHPSGEVVTATYNAAGQPTALGGWHGYVTGATYNALGQPQAIAFGNGVQTQYTYFGLGYQVSGNPNQFYGRVRQICVTTNNCALGYFTGTLLNLAYWYDGAGNVTTLRDDTNNQRENFAYDPLDRLTSAMPSPLAGVTTTLDYTETYSYDAIGNLTSKAGVTYSYTDTLHKHAVTALSNGSSFQYDANGNMVVRVEGGVTYTQTWNIDNRLVSVTKGSQTTSYYYDADGALVRKVEPRGQTLYGTADYEVFTPTLVTATIPSTFTHKLYMPVAFGASTGACPGTCTYYRFGGQPVAVRSSDSVYWLHGDHLGSASATTDINGTRISELRYTPYGQTRYSSGDTPTNKRFTSQEEQAGIGLYSFGARFYVPSIGRFLSADSIMPRPGDPQALNRYAYVRNSPVTRVDPSGHGDCNVHTTAGCLPWTIADLVFQGPDFLYQVPVDPSSTFNPYDPFGVTTAQVQQAAQLFNVPAPFIAAALNFENQPAKLPWGAYTRRWKQQVTPLLQRIDPGHETLGWSLGPANVKPGRAAELEDYYLTHYDPESPEYKWASTQRYLRDMGGLPEASPLYAASYVAASIRWGIDHYYSQGYSGPISKEGAAVVIGSHGQPYWYAANGVPAPGGSYGVALMVNLSESNQGLPFLGK